MTEAAPDAGFATPAAVVVSLAIGLVAAAVAAAGVAELRLADADLAKAKREAALDAGQQQAELAILSAGPSARLAWTVVTPTGPVQVLAESETAKLGLASIQDLDGGAFRRLDVTDAAELRRRLAAMGTAGAAQGLDLALADDSPLWRSCARSAFSPYGVGKALRVAPAAAPLGGPFNPRAGEVWRVRLTMADGWTDERVVRFTGDRYDPFGVIQRRFYRGGRGGDRCEAVLSAN